MRSLRCLRSVNNWTIYLCIYWSLHIRKLSNSEHEIKWRLKQTKQQDESNNINLKLSGSNWEEWDEEKGKLQNRKLILFLIINHVQDVRRLQDFISRCWQLHLVFVFDLTTLFLICPPNKMLPLFFSIWKIEF